MSDDLESRRRARKLTDEEMNANLRAAVKGHTPYADRKQAELRQPLTEAELKAGGGYMPAITDVDMTPRPRYRESQAAFEARMAAMGADMVALRTDVKQRNRNAALRSIEPATGAIAYWTQCACSWCGLRVEDPELARREYDAHVCAAAGVGQAAVDRAIAETDRNVLVKRERHVLKPSVVGPVESEAPRTVVVEDDFEQRVKLLETK